MCKGPGPEPRGSHTPLPEWWGPVLSLPQDVGPSGSPAASGLAGPRGVLGAQNVLDIVEGRTVTWMGLFYCPLLPLLNSVFIFLTFYIRR